MANPFEKFKAPAAVKSNNPFAKFKPITPVDPEEGISFDQYSKGLDDPENLQQSIDQNNAVRTIDAQSSKDDILQSQSDIYGKIREDKKYAPLNVHENSLAYKLGAVNDPFNDTTYSPSSEFPFMKAMPPELVEMRKKRDAELNAAYENTGSADTYKIPENIPGVGGMDTGIPFRSQTVKSVNPDFDTSQPPSEDNPIDINTKYAIDPPTRTAINRMGYQVLQNIIGGIGDFAAEGKLSGEGKIGKSLPETIPDNTGEEFATTMTTFILDLKDCIFSRK